MEKYGAADVIKERTGLPLSTYFSASKLAEEKNLCMGTIDSWLVYKMTRGKVFKTEFSNASSTQLFNIHELKWDEKICAAFGIPVDALAEPTYGTGSSIMMNVGEDLIKNPHGIASTITWLKDNVGLINSAAESEDLADKTYFVPAFKAVVDNIAY